MIRLRNLLLIACGSILVTPAWALTVQQRLAALEKSNKKLTDTVAALRAALNNNTVLKLNGKLQLNGSTALFKGLNVQIINGEGKTDSTNGKGNLILGYNEGNTKIHPVCSNSLFIDQISCEAVGEIWAGSQHTGSHYLILGRNNSYTQYAGLVAGYNNASTGPYASITGGRENTATGFASHVSGGLSNTAQGSMSSVSGGRLNLASGGISTVSGGISNGATGLYSSISGGTFNGASGVYSSVSGGNGNSASAEGSSVSGGKKRAAIRLNGWTAGTQLEQ